MDFLENYRVKITTIGPLYIGSGKTIGKKDYAYLKNTNQFYFFKTEKLMKELITRNLLERFQNYLIQDRRSDIGEWLRSVNIATNIWLEWVDYSVDAGNLTQQRRDRNILTFIKNPYGQPYIPGSSIKGALRTALLGAGLNEIQKKKGVEWIRQGKKGASGRKKAYKNANERIEIEFFHQLDRETPKKNAVNDIMSMIRVSDSGPVNKDRLMIAQKIDKNVDQEYNILPINRECIMPETSFECMITIDKKYFPYTIDEVMNFIRVFYKNYQNNFVDAFEVPDNDDKNTKFYLGGGPGFASKTIPYQIMEVEESVEIVQDVFRKTLDTKIYKEHKHDRDVHDYQTSPHMMKFAKYKQKYYEMGLCKLELIE